MNREIITQAKELIKKGYSFHDKDVLCRKGYSNPGILDAMETISKHVILIRFYNLSSAVVKYYEKHPDAPMTLSEIRGYMYETSQLMLSDGYGLAVAVTDEELEYAANYTIFEVEENE